jgi:hypothetical protein
MEYPEMMQPSFDSARHELRTGLHCCLEHQYLLGRYRVAFRVRFGPHEVIIMLILCYGGQAGGGMMRL